MHTDRTTADHPDGKASPPPAPKLHPNCRSARDQSTPKAIAVRTDRWKTTLSPVSPDLVGRFDVRSAMQKLNPTMLLRLARTVPTFTAAILLWLGRPMSGPPGSKRVPFSLHAGPT